MITVCIVGDGESETGPTATAWHAHKYIDWAESVRRMQLGLADRLGRRAPDPPRQRLQDQRGMSRCTIRALTIQRTIPGTMDDRETVALYTGLGYQCCIVEYGDLNNPTAKHDTQLQKDLYAAMHWAVAEIRKIQKAARSGKPIDKPRPPMVVLRSPKGPPVPSRRCADRAGWTGPLKLDGNPLVNSFRSHQVPLPKAATDDEQFSMLQDWLAAYHPESLWDFDAKDSIIRPDVCDVVPESDKLKLGLVKETWRGHQALDLPDEWADYGGAKDLKDETSPMLATGKYLTEVIRRNPKRFRIFSPDELASNKLNGVFDVTHRNFRASAPSPRPDSAQSGTPRRRTRAAASSRCSPSTRCRATCRCARPPESR